MLSISPHVLSFFVDERQITMPLLEYLQRDILSYDILTVNPPILIGPSKDPQVLRFEISYFISKMDLPHADVDNLMVFFKDITKGGDVMSIQSLREFILRFGFMAQIPKRITEFIKCGAREWYHGNIAKPAAEQRLIQFAKQNQCGCYLIRNAIPIQKVPGKVEAWYAFVFSFCPDKTYQVSHMRLYIDTIGKIYTPTNAEHTENIYINDWNFDMIDKVSSYKKVSCDHFQALTI